MNRFFTPTREWFIPKGATKIADKQSDAVAYLCINRQGKPRAVVFFGKQAKPVFDYYYQNEQRREANVKQAFENRRARLASKAETNAKRKAFVNPYKVGDLFQSSWGYDQTNVDWYEVVAVSGKMLTVREICQERTETGWLCGKCVPLPGQFREKSDPIRCLAQDGAIKVDSHRWAYYRPGKEIAGVKVHDSSYWSSYA